MSFEIAMLREEHLKSQIFKKIFFPFVVSDRLMVSGAQKNSRLKDIDCVESNILPDEYYSRQNVSCPVFLSNEYEDYKDLVIGRKFEPINIPGHNIRKGELYYPSEKNSEFEQNELRELIQKNKVLEGVTYPTYKYDGKHSCWKVINNKYYIFPDGKVYLVLEVDANDGKTDFNGKTYRNGELVAFEVGRQNFYLDDYSEENYKTNGNELYNYMGILENGYVVGGPFGVKYKVWTEYKEGHMYVEEIPWSRVVPSDGRYFPAFITGGTYYSRKHEIIPITKKKEFPDKRFCDFFNGPYFENLVNLQEKTYELIDKGIISDSKKKESDRKDTVSKEAKHAGNNFFELLQEYKRLTNERDRLIGKANGDSNEITAIKNNLDPQIEQLGKRIDKINDVLRGENR